MTPAEDDTVLPSPLNHVHIGLLTAFYVLSVSILVVTCYYSNTYTRRRYHNLENYNYHHNARSNQLKPTR